MDQLPRLGKRELICLMLFTCNYVVSVRRGFLFLWVLGMGYVILLWQSLCLPYNYFTYTIWLKWPSGFGEKYQFSYLKDIGSRSRNDLDLQKSHTFIKSISYLHLSMLQATVVFEKSTVSLLYTWVIQ